LSDVAGPGAGPVLLDTDVFSKVYVPASRDDVGRAWVAALAGRTVVISVQTAVDLRVWPRLRNWGEQRTAALLERILSVPTIQVNELVQAAFVDLTVWAKGAGHGIGAKDHTADRWIAATALAYGLELAAIDGIYEGIEGLSLLQT
jgi:predicted nucleic acid-binding protein